MAFGQGQHPKAGSKALLWIGPVHHDQVTIGGDGGPRLCGLRRHSGRGPFSAQR